MRQREQLLTYALQPVVAGTIVHGISGAGSEPPANHV